jgi:AcrR family transcriptional regulator
VQEEIKERAWEQIRAAGAPALSLNAIAKQMGMSGPALYRYFASRDELITALIRDAYRSLADAFRRQAQTESGADVTELAQVLRRWALEDPQRFFLVYGTPVPGYEAPPDTTSIAAEIMAVLLDACAAANGTAAVSSPLQEHLAEHRTWAGDHPAPPSALHRALVFWTRLNGVLSLELAGQFTNMGFDPAQLYDAEVRSVMGS